MTKNVVTKKAKLLNYLTKGHKVSRKLALARFNMKNLRAAINNLRNEGNAIDTLVDKKTGTRYQMVK
jgi:hypothetical protein